MSSRIPLDLFVEVETADGTRFKWDANQSPANRLTNASFRTKIGEGFADANGQLARPIDQDYPDLGLVNTVTFVGADGSVAYEGRLSAMPRELGDRHTIGVLLAGWMAHAKDRKFAMPIVDRDIGQWASAPTSQRSSQLGAGISLGDLSWARDEGGLVLALPNQALGALTAAEAWYTAPTGVTIAKIQYRGKTTSFPGAWTNLFVATDTGTDSYTPTLDDTLRTVTLTTARRSVFSQVFSNGSAVTPTSGASAQFSKLAVYGNHGITTRTGDTSEPDGVYASDVIRWIADTYCPKLDASGVQDTTYVIQHLAFNERTYPFDAFLEVNKHHLWHLGVWENRKLVYRPYDLTDYDWEIRTDDPGTTFNPQGPSTEDLFNGITVTYTDILTDRVETLTPDTYSQLLDTSTSNPWNQHGIQKWDEITLSTPTLAAQALKLGQAALADRNRPRAPGTITVRGYIRDRAGNKQPAWKPRAGDTIAITNFPNDDPRLIVETDYDVESKTIRLSIDKPFALLDAYLDRLGTALGAAGLG